MIDQIAALVEWPNGEYHTSDLVEAQRCAQDMARIGYTATLSIVTYQDYDSEHQTRTLIRTYPAQQ